MKRIMFLFALMALFAAPLFAQSEPQPAGPPGAVEVFPYLAPDEQPGAPTQGEVMSGPLYAQWPIKIDVNVTLKPGDLFKGTAEEAAPLVAGGALGPKRPDDKPEAPAEAAAAQPAESQAEPADTTEIEKREKAVAQAEAELKSASGAQAESKQELEKRVADVTDRENNLAEREKKFAAVLARPAVREAVLKDAIGKVKKVNDPKDFIQSGAPGTEAVEREAVEGMEISANERDKWYAELYPASGA